MNRIILLLFAFALAFQAPVSWAMQTSQTFALDFSKSKTKSIKSRYKGKIEDKQFIFSETNLEYIASYNLAPLIKKLILHNTIRFEDLDDVLSFASTISESTFDFEQLEHSIVRRLKKGDPVFTALDHAIQRAQTHQWHIEIVERVTHENDDFVTQVNLYPLSDNDKKRVIKVYGSCIASFADETYREYIRFKKACDGVDEFKRPRHERYPVTARTSSDDHASTRSDVYKLLMDKASSVANELDLSVFDRVIMAKCIAEQSLHFFPYTHHPLKALYKSRLVSRRSPEQTFFMRTGICSNFSAIAYNAALALGLEGKIYLTRRYEHVYLEFNVGGEWFHAHPFDSKTQCTINRFIESS